MLHGIPITAVICRPLEPDMELGWETAEGLLLLCVGSVLIISICLENPQLGFL